MLVSLSSQRVKVTVRREDCNKSNKSKLGHVRPDTVDLRILSLSWTNSVNLTTKNFFSVALLLTTSLPTTTPLVTPAPPVPQQQQILPPRRVSDLELLGNSNKVWISLLVTFFFFFFEGVWFQTKLHSNQFSYHCECFETFLSRSFLDKCFNNFRNDFLCVGRPARWSRRKRRQGVCLCYIGSSRSRSPL